MKNGKKLESNTKECRARKDIRRGKIRENK